MRYHRKSKVKSQKSKLWLLMFLAVTVFINGCGNRPIVKKTKPLMGTWVSIKVHDPFKRPKELEQLIEKAFGAMEKIDALMSGFREDSEVSQINRLNPGESIKVSPETLMVINKGGVIHDITNGAFDVTVAPLVKLWDSYGAQHSLMPPSSEIEEALGRVGQDKLLVDGKYGTVGISKKGMALDLAGIAKGFAVDEAVKVLLRNGIKSALVDAGGDIYCLGEGPSHKPWAVGVRHPREDKIVATLRLKDIAVATSGDYENFIIIGGRRFSHIIDPRTGYPEEGRPIGVTVLAGDCATADGLATGLSVLRAEEGMALLNRLDGVEAVIISDEGGSLKIDLSDGLKGLYEFEE